MTSTPPSNPAARPRILLVGLLPGLGGMHLPRHLARADLDVVFCGVRTAFASHSGHVRAFYAWPSDGGLAVTPFIDCVTQSRPDWVVPLDELAAQVLQQIGVGQLQGAQRPLPAEVVTLVRKSLGDPRGYPLFAVRRRAFESARAAGVPVALQADANTFEACAAFARLHGYPVVLKQESSRGGAGTILLDTEAALRDFTSSERFRDRK
ncbi:ATP-binding protein [Paraburkholderia heleia]|nr:hypothetical protein [Paraburkholderia heleia]